MKNVTITLPEKTFRWARIMAAKQNRSLSRMIAGMLQSMMDDEKTYSRSMKAFLAFKPEKLSRATSYPSRESLHER